MSVLTRGDLDYLKSAIEIAVQVDREKLEDIHSASDRNGRSGLIEGHHGDRAIDKYESTFEGEPPPPRCIDLSSEGDGRAALKRKACRPDGHLEEHRIQLCPTIIIHLSLHSSVTEHPEGTPSAGSQDSAGGCGRCSA